MRYVVSRIIEDEKDIAYRFYLTDSLKISHKLEGKRLFDIYQDIDDAFAGDSNKKEPDAKEIIDNVKFKLAQFVSKKK